jgi:hypothetical protein
MSVDRVPKFVEHFLPVETLPSSFHEVWRAPHDSLEVEAFDRVYAQDNDLDDYPEVCP